MDVIIIINYIKCNGVPHYQLHARDQYVDDQEDEMDVLVLLPVRACLQKLLLGLSRQTSRLEG